MRLTTSLLCINLEACVAQVIKITSSKGSLNCGMSSSLVGVYSEYWIKKETIGLSKANKKQSWLRLYKVNLLEEILISASYLNLFKRSFE